MELRKQQLKAENDKKLEYNLKLIKSYQTELIQLYKKQREAKRETRSAAYTIGRREREEKVRECERNERGIASNIRKIKDKIKYLERQNLRYK